jgi:hypothetical protein
MSGQMDEKLIENSLILAQLDTILRAGTSVLLSKNFIENFGKVNSKDVADLKNLITIIPKNLFRAKKLCVLNPSFKEAELVHGADCDLILDDTIIEIKTIKKLEFRSESFYQLLGYYILNEIGGITILGKIEINKLGIYYSRFGYFFQFNIQDVIDLNKISEVKKWFVDYAKKLLKKFRIFPSYFYRILQIFPTLTLSIPTTYPPNYYIRRPQDLRAYRGY